MVLDTNDTHVAAHSQTAILVGDHSKPTNVIYKCGRNHGDKPV